MKKILSSTVCFLSLIPTAYANDIMGGGPLYGNAAQVSVVCLFANLGTRNVVVKQPAIFDTSGNPGAPVVNTCTAPSGSAVLLPNHGCFLRILGVEVTTAYSCRAVIAPNKTDVRGTIDIRDGTNRTLATTNLQ